MSAGSPTDSAAPRVCHCWKVSVSHIQQAVREGCRNVDALGRKTGAGTACGNCFGDLERELEQALHRHKLEKDGQYLLPISRAGN